jgi:hypothetical protein
MTIDWIEAVRQQTAHELERIDEGVRRHQQGLKELKARRRKVRRAMQLLEGNEAETASKAIVRPIVEDLLRQNATIDYEAIYDLTCERLKEQRISSSCMGSWLHQLLKEAWVVEVEPGVFALRDAVVEDADRHGDEAE